MRVLRKPGVMEAADEPIPAEAAQPTLPHPDTVDPKKILAPVLTSVGWVCPHPKDKDGKFVDYGGG